jgi:hypothetical protein
MINNKIHKADMWHSQFCHIGFDTFARMFKLELIPKFNKHIKLVTLGVMWWWVCREFCQAAQQPHNLALATLGDLEPDDKVVNKYLCIACPRYKQLVISIETLLDSMDLSVEDIAGRLKAIEDDKHTDDGHEGEKLYLIEEQWLERYK